MSEEKEVLEVWDRYNSRYFKGNQEASDVHFGRRIFPEYQGNNPIEEEEVKKPIAEMKTGKAASRDNIVPAFIKYDGPELVGPL